MPKIDFNFKGYIRGADIDITTDVNGEPHDVSGMNSEELVDKLEK